MGHIPMIAEKIAQLHHVNVEKVMFSARENTKKMYGIWKCVWLVGWLVGWFVGWLVGWFVPFQKNQEIILLFDFFQSKVHDNILNFLVIHVDSSWFVIHLTYAQILLRVDSVWKVGCWC